MKKYTVSEYEAVLNDLKKIKLSGLTQYEAWRFLYISIYRYMYLPREESKRNIIKRFVFGVSTLAKIFIKLCCVSYSLGNTDKINDNIILYLSDYYASRSDMKATMNNIGESFDEAVLVPAGKARKISLNPKNVFLPFCWFFKISRLNICDELKLIVLNETARAYIFDKCIKKNRDAILRANALLSLNDENADENVLTQFCKANGIVTASLQHGHFWDTKQSEELINYAHNFRGLTADYLLTWGKYTRDMAVKDGVSPERLIPAGIPKYIGVTEKLPVEHNKIFGVFFDTVSLGAETNYDLARFANYLSENYGYKFTVKLHPTDSEQRYKDIFNDNFIGFAEPMSVIDYSKTVDFSLVCFSTVFFEQIFFNKPSFRYLPESAIDVFEGLDFSAFSDEGSLKEKMDLYVNDEQCFMEKYREMSEYCCGEGDLYENYKEAMRFLNSEGKKS